MPKEYTSTALVMRPWLSSSGGMYGTVPKLCVLRCVTLRSSTRLSPKSASLRQAEGDYVKIIAQSMNQRTPSTTMICRALHTIDGVTEQLASMGSKKAVTTGERRQAWDALAYESATVSDRRLEQHVRRLKVAVHDAQTVEVVHAGRDVHERTVCAALMHCTTGMGITLVESIRPTSGTRASAGHGGPTQ